MSSQNSFQDFYLVWPPDAARQVGPSGYQSIHSGLQLGHSAPNHNVPGAGGSSHQIPEFPPAHTSSLENHAPDSNC